MTENKEFQFKPRQEAHPMKWDELLSPVRRAVTNLLIRIDGAERVNEEDDRKEKKEVANCFLVYGIRGTGKTTVLLSAEVAVCSRDFFMPLKQKEESDEEKLEKKAARESVKYLQEKYIVWLPILDLEPLTASSNLLTTVLTRVRNALEQKNGYDKKGSAQTSIFEESADSARQQFNKLINDATLIWEDIQEVDTRGKASRQVAAADIYANFRERFQKAMTALSEQLSRVHGRESKGCSIILPIDNIDRSTDHLHAIFKLAQLVSHSRLWLVMAGDRVDVETFLERAYWKELIYRKDGASAMGKKGWDGEDEALVMARRQAAATYQKLLPPSHRIEVDRVKPKDTLEFKPSAIDENEKSTHQLLGEIYIFLNESKVGGSEKICFTDLLDARKYVETSEVSEAAQQSMLRAHKVVDKYLIKEGIDLAGQKSFLVAHEIDDEHLMYFLADKTYPSNDTLTHLAGHGLHLPARTVLDLWQLAHCVVDDTLNTEKEKLFQAEKIARTMLRNAIFRSDMSSKMGDRLQDDIIRRSSDGGTILYFGKVKPKVGYLAKSDFELPCCRLNITEKKNPNYAIRTKLCIEKEVDIVISLDSEDLPDIVGAWLSILYDILILVERLAVIDAPEIKTYIVSASHEVIISNQHMRKDKPKQKDNLKKKDDAKAFWWPAPLWKTFLAYDVFWKRWAKFRDNLPKEKLKNDDLTKLLAAVWVACVLQTFTALNRFNFDSVLMKILLEKKGIHESEQQKITTKEFNEFKKAIIKAFIDINSIPTIPTKAILEKKDAHESEQQRITFEELNEFEKAVIKAFIEINSIPTIPTKAILEKKDAHKSEQQIFNTEDINEFEKEVIKAAHDLYSVVASQSKLQVLIAEKQIRDWLEQKLPLMFSYLYVPMGNEVGAADERCKKMIGYESDGKESDLTRYWQNNAPFFLADLDEELDELFPKDKVPFKKLDSDDDKYWYYIGSIGPFGALHRYWKVVSPLDVKG